MNRRSFFAVVVGALVIPRKPRGVGWVGCYVESSGQTIRLMHSPGFRDCDILDVQRELLSMSKPMVFQRTQEWKVIVRHQPGDSAAAAELWGDA